MRLSLRMQRDEARLVLSQARASGLSIGRYVAGLCSGVPALSNGSRPFDLATALTTSCAELSTLARDLRHLTLLLRQGKVRSAQEYRERLDTRSAMSGPTWPWLRPSWRRCNRSGPQAPETAPTTRQRSEFMDDPARVDAVLIQWGDRLFYPANRIVRTRPQPRLSGLQARQRAAQIRARIEAIACAAHHR